MEELLQTVAGLGLVGVTRIVLEAVGEHELHVGDELTCCLIFTVVDFLSDGAQSDRLLDDVIVVGNLRSGHQLHEGPAVFVSHQLHSQLLAGRQLVDAMVPPRRPPAGRGRRGRGGGRGEDREDGFGGFKRRSSI